MSEKLNARIAELERQLVESRDYAISEAAKIRTEHQQNVLVDRLLGASNYIDRLGGNSAVFRQSLVAVKGETP